MKIKSAVLYSILIIIGAILFDQITKGCMLHLLTGNIPLSGNAFEIVQYPYMVAQVTSFFNVVFTWNPGTSFSLFRTLGESAPYALVGLTLFVIGFLTWYLFAKKHENLERIGLALIVGGALGNLIDRLRFGAVIDFLDVHAGAIHWPAFNGADICISVGVALYIVHWLFFSNRKK